MKKQKTVNPFSFKNMDHQEMVDLLNDKNPISIKYNEDLINRIYARYPMLDKTTIAIIVKATFASFRDLLVLGEILNFHNLFFDTKLKFFTHVQNNIAYPALKVLVSTPPRMKK